MAAKMVEAFRQLRCHVRFLWVMAAIQAVIIGVQVAQQLAE
jgi:hypothetical protein